MRIAFVALALVAVAIVYLELQLAEGKIRMKIPKLKLKKGPKIRVPKVKKTHMHMPKAKHIGRATLGATHVVSTLGATGADIAGTVLNHQNSQQTDEASRR
nr:uncharacterized protein LOC119167874 isoform X2 [Rhipicephalus microplus]